MFDDKWNPTFNSAQGKAAADFFVGTLKSIAPPGVAEFDSDQEGAAILGGDAAAIIQYSGNAIKSDDPAASKEVGKLDFGVVPKQEKALAQIGIFIHGVLGVGAEQGQRDRVHEVVRQQRRPRSALARSGDLPVKIAAFSDPRRSRRTGCCRSHWPSCSPGRRRGRAPPTGRRSSRSSAPSSTRRSSRGAAAARPWTPRPGQVKDYLKAQGYYD